MKKILIRADDLGYSEGVNYGIAKSVKDGITGSVGFMPNMAAAEHGFQLLKGLPVCFGLHTNICVGHPVTNPRLIPSLCQEDGSFKTSKTYREAFARGEDFVSLDEAVMEIEAQYRRFVEIVGDQPHYFECHAAGTPNFTRGLEIVAKRYSLPYLDFAMIDKEGYIPFRKTKLYFIMKAFASDYEPLECLKQAATQDYGPDGVGMVVFHPGYLDDYLLNHSSLTINRAKEVAVLCDPAVKQWLDKQGVELITYDDI